MEEKKSLKIGSQNIDFEELRKLNNTDLIKVLESVYFDGYSQALKTVDTKISENIEQLISIKRDTSVLSNQTTTTPTEEKQEPMISSPKLPEDKIAIEIITTPNNGPKDPLEQRMKEIEQLVYKFKTKGYVIFRMNGIEEEYLKNKYGFTTLPMKALVFATEEEAIEHKELYWGAGYDELSIRQV